MPTADADQYFPVQNVVEFVKKSLKKDEEAVMNVAFGKQDGTSDCFHRCIDFIGRITEKHLLINKIPTMKYFITRDRKRVPVPKSLYGRI